MALNIGELVHDVTVQQLTDTTGPSRYPVETWATLCQAWMSKSGVRGSERFVNGVLSAPAQMEWECRYRSDLDPDLVDVQKTRRLIYQGRVYDITKAEVKGRHDYLCFSTLSKSKVA